MAEEDYLESRKNILAVQWDYICRLFLFISIGCELMVIIAEIIIMSSNINHYTDIMGEGNSPSTGYERDGSSASCGFVANTNSPKHLGSIFFSAVNQTSIILWCVFIIAAECVFLFKTKSNYGNAALTAFHIRGIMEGEDNHKAEDPIPPYFIIATGFLKLYVVAIFEAQSFVGIGRGAHDPSGEGTGPDGQQFCLWAGLILLGSILPGIVAQTFVRYKIKMKEYWK